MANPYTSNQQWTQSQMHYEPQQMNQDFNYSAQNGQGQQLDPNAFVDPNSYYGNAQQQIPPNPQPNTSSSLHGAFNMSQPNGAQQAQGSMGGGFAFGQQQGGPSINRSAAAPYRTAPTNFNFASVGPGPAGASSQGASVNNGPANVFQTPAALHNQLPQASGSTLQHQQNYYNDGEPLSKRHHGVAFNDLTHESDEAITQEQKDAKAKLYVHLPHFHFHLPLSQVFTTIISFF